MRIILCGLMFSNSGLQVAKKNSKTSLQMASHTFLTNLANGLTSVSDDVDLSIINIPPVGSFPMNYKRLLIEREPWGKDNVGIGYLNLPVMKHSIQKHSLIREIEKRLDLKHPEDNFLLVYHTYLPFLEAVKHIKKKYPGVHTALIATDCVPGRGDMEKYMTPAAVRRGDKAVELAKWCDGFVLLTKYLAEALETGERPYVITECIANEKQIHCQSSEVSKNRCLYTGSINREFGICELAEAFAKLDNAELWICGSGSGKDYIEGVAKTHKNIKYFGFVDQERLQELRDQSDFLINPRRPTGTYTKYSFPSKTAEYMMSGKPVIMYKLEGLPDSYDEYLNYLTADTPERIKDELVKIFEINYSSLLEKADLGRSFMLENASSVAQAKKIVGLFQKLSDTENDSRS